MFEVQSTNRPNSSFELGLEVQSTNRPNSPLCESSVVEVRFASDGEENLREGAEDAEKKERSVCSSRCDVATTSDDDFFAHKSET